MNVSEALIRWLAEGERGTSSNTIVQHLTGVTALDDWGPDHPHDPDDLRRCVELLDACPELGERLGEMRTCSPVWGRLVDAWPELVGLLREETQRSDGMARRCYSRMCEVIGDG